MNFCTFELNPEFSLDVSSDFLAALNVLTELTSPRFDYFELGLPFSYDFKLDVEPSEFIGNADGCYY